MDIRQVEELLALLLANCRFQDAPGDLILTAAKISRQEIGAFLTAWNSAAALKCPFAVVRVVSSKDDSDGASHASGSMGRGVRQFMRATVYVVAGSIADPLPSPPPFVAVGNVVGDDVHGAGAIVGKNPAIGTQAGQGIDRIATEVVRQAFGDGVLVDAVHGVSGRATFRSDLAPVYGSQLLARRIDLEITNGSTRQSFHAPYRLKAAVVGTTATLSWRGVPTRPDFVGYVLKRDGVQVYAGTALTYVDAIGANGVYSYTLAAVYDDVTRPPVTSNRSSALVTLSVTV